jgi:hypothetical protein
MKLKADFHVERPDLMQAAVETKEFRDLIYREVLAKSLRIPQGWGPAEFYIQQCDLAVGAGPMCEVRLSGVSVNRLRSTQDFFDARGKLEEIYRDTVKPFLKPGERMQMMVTIMLDAQPYGHTSTMVEAPPIWITGE